MRLLFVIDNDEPHASGGGYYAPFKFAQFLARRGHEVLAYAAHDLGWVRPEPRLRLLFRPTLPRRVRILRKADKLLARAADRIILMPAAAAHRPDWVFGVLKESAIKAVAVGRAVGARVANFVYETPLWLRDMAGEEASAREYTGYTRDLWEATRRAYLASDRLFPNSALAGEWAARWLDGRVVAPPIPPGVDPDEMPFEAGAGAGSDRAPAGRLLYVGRLAPMKRVGDLIEACRRLDPIPALDLVGEGPEEARLRALAADRPEIRFHGFVDDPTLWRMYAASDLVVCPSAFEGFGMPPMQALYFARPCLVSDIPIFRSIYGDHVDRFPLGDVDALAQAIRRLLADPAGRARRGAEGRRFVLENFTWAESARRIEAALAAAEPAR
ncbi:MAG TPA: glycosyltransferase family 4 protein [Dongiaceae bacterium]|nr:glycosyltransferase family 4 protein [Dongiaceae bacterium]